MASQQFEPPSGTRDFLAGDLRVREHVFATIREVFERYGFEPLQTPAFERLETLTGKYGDEGDKLIFKILRRGEHEVSGEADLALRYDMTVPLARVVAAHGSQLPVPYKRYAMGPAGALTGRDAAASGSSRSVTWMSSARLPRSPTPRWSAPWRTR